MTNKEKLPVSEELLFKKLVSIISETNGVSLTYTLELLRYSYAFKDSEVSHVIDEFQELIWLYQQGRAKIDTLLSHPLSSALFRFFKEFPISYCEEHTHLTGSLDADFIYPRLKKLLQGENKEIYQKKIEDIYGPTALPIESKEDVSKLISLGTGEQFESYLKILFLAKCILIDRQTHLEAANYLAKTLYEKYNIGQIRLKFTLSRANSIASEQIPGLGSLSAEDVVMGLYDGFKWYQRANPKFRFYLSPCFRKEPDFYDHSFSNKSEHIDYQIDELLKIIEKHPELNEHLEEIDTVGDERGLYKKSHFMILKNGFRKLQYKGFRIRSHHGETWNTLRKGIQSVDNAMNIWRIDALEHGLSLGINPNYYYQRLFQRAIEINMNNHHIEKDTPLYNELNDMEWGGYSDIKQKLFSGKKISSHEKEIFLNVKFHYSTEIEQYQHDVLNRMILKNISLVSLPTSNLKLTGSFPDYKHHPFSWWEKKGVDLGVGTDNYVTLSTNYIREMLILLYSDPDDLKIMKLLSVTTKEKRRNYLSKLLWDMHKKYCSDILNVI